MPVILISLVKRSHFKDYVNMYNSVRYANRPIWKSVPILIHSKFKDKYSTTEVAAVYLNKLAVYQISVSL